MLSIAEEAAEKMRRVKGTVGDWSHTTLCNEESHLIISQDLSRSSAFGGEAADERDRTFQTLIVGS